MEWKYLYIIVTIRKLKSKKVVVNLIFYLIGIIVDEEVDAGVDRQEEVGKQA